MNVSYPCEWRFLWLPGALGSKSLTRITIRNRQRKYHYCCWYLLTALERAREYQRSTLARKRSSPTEHCGAAFFLPAADTFHWQHDSRFMLTIHRGSRPTLFPHNPKRLPRSLPPWASVRSQGKALSRSSKLSAACCANSNKNQEAKRKNPARWLRLAGGRG